VVGGLAEPPGYAHVAWARADGSRLVFTAGAVPLDAAGDLVGGDDPVAQARQVLANLEQQLAEGGATPDDVVKTTVYVAGASHEHQNAVWEVVQASPFASAPSTLLGVALLGYRGQLVEIEAIAIVDGGRHLEA
jgi:enamine deaminase RidA (YjgF/YER057c/UK114 family)